MEQTNYHVLTQSNPEKASVLADQEQVRIVKMNELEQATQCLAEAFATDELARYFVDTDDMEGYSEEVKWKLHCYIIRCMTAAHLLKGVVTTVGPDFDAVALW